MKTKKCYELEYVKYDTRAPAWAVKKHSCDEERFDSLYFLNYKSRIKGANVFHTFWTCRESAVRYAESLIRHSELQPEPEGVL
jgi:hypothetical protein